MLDHLFITYGNITTADLENNFEQMRKAWDPHQPVGTLFKKIQDCADFSEAGGFTKIFAPGNFMSACRRWNEKDTDEKTWANFKAHFAAARRQGGSAANSGYHAANADFGQTEDQMAEAAIGALANLSTATATDRGVVATLTEANSCLAKQLEYRFNELMGIKELLKNERADRKGR
jgi:hypothetical protein